VRKKAGERTLLASVLLSAPGPIVLGAALMVGRSATQLADFIRRTAELGAIIVSWAVYRILNQGREPDPTHQARLERTASSAVGLAMCLSGAAMLLLALFSSGTEKGNVLPALIIALLGVLTNSWFWLRYRSLNRQGRDAILASQSRLYGAKTLVDGCVTAALAVVFVAPHSGAAVYVDRIGSLVVALYLAASGVGVLRGKATGSVA
jgi:divalent metal cation (Fe/Co/Zn/Cd) transporter